MPTFVLNDENVVNSYGFRVRNAGINLTRFSKNPVMLDSHVNETSHVMGKWEKWRIDGSQLKMDTVFDTEYDEAKRLQGQVERGFVNGASPGLGIDWEGEPFQRQPDGVWELVISEMMEGTICGVPSGSSSLQLYDKATNEPITEDQIKLSLQKLSAEKLTPNNPKMEKIILTPGAMSALLGAGVTAPDNGTEISRGVEKLQADLTDSKNKVTELQGKIDDQVKLQAKALADQAQLDGKITGPEEHAELLADAIVNFSLTAKLVAKMPGKVSLSDKINNTEGASTVKTMDDFFKLSHEAQLAFKKDHLAEYQKLFA